MDGFGQGRFGVKETTFRAWLTVERGLKASTVGSRIGNCLRVERHEGDLDAHYDADELADMLRRLDPREPGHGIPIAGDVYSGTATLKNAVRLYRDFRKGGDRRVSPKNSSDRPVPAEWTAIDRNCGPMGRAAANDAFSVTVNVGENMFDGVSIAVLIPCLDEEAAIAGVVRDFKAALPTAEIHVYDNASTDGTVGVAREAGALVRSEPMRGKGNVVRRMFADIDADLFVLVDGDGTYPVDRAPAMIETLIADRLDMVTGVRIADRQSAYRPGHRFGNRTITGLVGQIFGRRFSDILSGYRVMSRRFVKSFPALSKGFEIETEITVHALEMRLPCAELEIPYFERPAGSSSKLRTVRDGIRIVRTIVALIREERPLEFFCALFAALELAAVILAWPLLPEYLETGLVPRLPTAVLSTGLALLGFLSLACGLILDTVTLGRREIRRLRYLSLPGPPARDEPHAADPAHDAKPLRETAPCTPR